MPPRTRRIIAQRLAKAQQLRRDDDGMQADTEDEDEEEDGSGVEEMEIAKRKMRSMSYGSKGQDPRKLLSHYDRDNSGELDWSEFKAAVRKGGHVSAATLSDELLRKLFDEVDGDGSGDVSIEEMTAFVWGGGSGGGRASDAAATASPEQQQQAVEPAEGSGGADADADALAERYLALDATAQRRFRKLCGLD